MKKLLIILALVSVSSSADDYFNNPTQQMMNRLNSANQADALQRQQLQQQTIQIQGVGRPSDSFSNSYNTTPPANRNYWDNQ